MTEFYKSPVQCLTLGEHKFYHRGNCEFELVRHPSGSFMPWSLHSMIEESAVGISRNMPCLWSASGDSVAVEISSEKQGRAVWRFYLGPHGLLRFRMEVTNASTHRVENAFVLVHNFPSPRLFRGEMTYVQTGDGLRELRELWPKGVDAGQGVYPFEGKCQTVQSVETGGYWKLVPCSLTLPMVCRIGGGNEPTPHARWCESSPIVAGMACERIAAVYSNYIWPCLDLRMDFGTIGPGQTASQDGLIGILEGTLQDFVDCARAVAPGAPAS